MDNKNKIEEQRAHATLGNTHFQQAERLQSEAVNIHSYIDECEECLKYAEEEFNIALRLCEELRFDVDMKEYLLMKARLFTNLGLIYDIRLNEDMCISYFKRAIKITEKLNLKDDLYRCQFNLSGFFHRNGKLTEGLNFVNDAIRTASHIKDKCAERDALLLKAKMFVDCGKLELSKKILTKAYKMKLRDAENINLDLILKKVIKLIYLTDDQNECPQGNHLQLLNIHEMIGDINASMDCYISALKHYKLMEEHATLLGYSCEKLLPVLMSIEQTYRDLRKYDDAIQYLSKQISCYNITDFKSICRIKMDMAFLYRLCKKPLGDVKILYEEATTAAFESDNILLQIYTLNCLYIYLMKNQNTDFKSDSNSCEMLKAKMEEICVRNNINKIPDSFDFEDEILENLNDDSDKSSDVVGDIDLKNELDSSSDDDNTEKVIYSDRKKLDKKNQLGETPLHRACISGNYKKVLSLLDEGHPINPRDNSGWLPLHEAANHGFVRIVALLLDRGGRINDRGGDNCGGITPLHDACYCGHLDVVELFIDKGCDVMVKDDEGKTVLDALREFKLQAKLDIDINEFMRIEKKLLNKMNIQGNSVQNHATQNDKKLIKSNNDCYDVVNKKKQSKLNSICNDELHQENEAIHYKRKPKGKEIIKLYRNTIEDIRSCKRSNKLKLISGIRNIPALLPEEDAITDDWMIIDEAVKDELINNEDKSSKKKRKISDENNSLKKLKTNMHSLEDESMIYKDRDTNVLTNSFLDDDDDENFMRALNNSLLDNEMIINNVDNHTNLDILTEDLNTDFNNSSLSTSKDSAISQCNDFIINNEQILTDKKEECGKSNYIYDYCINKHNVINDTNKNNITKIPSNINNIHTYLDKSNKKHINNLISLNHSTSLQHRINRNKTLKNSKIHNFLKNPLDNRDCINVQENINVINNQNKTLHVKSNAKSDHDNIKSILFINDHMRDNINHTDTDNEFVNFSKNYSILETLNSDCSNQLNLENKNVFISENVNKIEILSPTNISRKFLKLLKIKIQDEIIAIPIYEGDDRETVSWLCLEASKRYSQIFQKKPKISLMLKDGANLAPMDSIQWILQEDLIMSRLIEWQRENIESKYIETCERLQLTAYSNIRKYLVACEKNNILSLNDLALSSAHFQPIALSFQNYITQLHLQGNKLGDEGLSMLLDGLNNLYNIEILNLSSNFITYSGIQKFKDFMYSFSHECRPLQNLNSIDLSCNNITSSMHNSQTYKPQEQYITNSPLITSTMTDFDTNKSNIQCQRYYENIDSDNTYCSVKKVDLNSGRINDQSNHNNGIKCYDSYDGNYLINDKVSDLWHIVCMLKILSKLELNSCSLIDNDLILPSTIRNINLTHIDLSLNAFTSLAISRIFNLLNCNVLQSCLFSSPINDEDLELKTILNETKNFKSKIFVDGVLLKNK